MLLLLLACEAPDDGFSPVAAASDPRVDELGLCGLGPAGDPPQPVSSGVTAPSPLGVGSMTVELGALEDPTTIDPTPRVGAVDYDLDLDHERYSVVVPPSYDGSEPYGLLVHVGAGDSGAARPDWIPLMDEHRLIWVGPEGAGNSQDVRRRIGLAALGAWRAQELFNVDTTRVYATGTSGGGRAGTMAALLHPGLFTGAMPVCGSAWLREVEQAYETQEPDSHYEFWGEWYFPDVGGQPYADWYLGHGQRVALITSYDDFREGDIQNIYHHGMSPDGVPVRLSEGEGGHCAVSADQARDALAWLDGPSWSVAGEDLVDAGSARVARQRVQWDSPAGLRARATLDGDGALALVPWQPLVHVSELLGGPGLVVSVEGEHLRVSLDEEELLSADLDGEGPTAIEVHWWADELQVRTSRHLVEAEAARGRVLDDQRVYHLRGPISRGWEAGGLLVLAGGQGWSDVSVLDATGFACE